MASSKKRTATRELNHENWNDDEEKEERGVFEQARSDVLQSRVIKKAKRRGVTSAASESGSGGTFAGFSGFKSASLASNESKPSFDFLKVDAAKGFGNGNGNGNGKEKNEEKGEKIPLSEMFKAKPGTWKCSVCDISNESTSGKCVACTSPKPGENASKPPPKWNCDTCMVPNAPEAKECVCCQAKKPGSDSKTSGFSFGKVEGSAFKFGTPNNNGSSFKLDSSSSGFKFGSSSTTKDSKLDSSSSGFKFGSSSTTTKDSPGSGFKFGAPSTTAASSPSGTGFKFGSLEKSNNNSEGSPASGFKFGASSVNASSGFSFGSTTTSFTSTASSDSSGFKFTTTTSSSPAGGPKSSPSSSTGFSFKSATPVATKGSTNLQPSSTPTTPSNSDAKFSSSFGSDLKGSASLPKEESSSSFSKSDSRDKYAANLRALNRQLSKWVKSKVDENPNVLLSPIFHDYENHLKEIAEKYPITSSCSKVSSPTESPKQEQAPLLGAVFGSKENKSDKVSFSTGSIGNTGFGNFSKSSEDTSSPVTAVRNVSTSDDDKSKEAQVKDKEEIPKSEGTSLFSFGSTAITSSGFNFGSTSSNSTSAFSFGTKSTPVFGSGEKSSSFFSGAATTASIKNDENTDNTTEDEPPKVEVKTVEENDAKFSMRCKLYYKKEKDFVDRGLGMVHIKLLDDNKKVQFLIRAETNLGNILLNIMLNDKITFTQRGNNLQFVAVPNPPIKGIPDGPTSMLVKVKNASMAEVLYGKIQEILKEAS